MERATGAADQAEVLAFLSDPAAHGLTDGTVERVETHASILFLAGDTVCKLKKPVSFGYMDFSTLDRRRRNCEAELAVNRAFAPELYRDVLPVTREADGRLALGGQGEPVEWLVRMRRFDQDLLFDRLAARGALDSKLLDALADAVLAMHDKAERRPNQGGADAFRRILLSNDAELRIHAPDLLPAEQVDALRDRSLAALERHAGILDGRRAAGFVRRCHGDLHLGNVCLIDGRPIPFDALEFDEALATVDVLYDLAFLLMDLWRLGLRAGANRVFNRYAARLAPDALDAFMEGLALFPLFLATRAGVRSHVAARTGGPEAADRARSYLGLALECLSPEPPLLIAIGGLSGSGKSTAAAALAPRIGSAPGALVLRSDALRKALFGVAPEERLPERAYSESVSGDVYARLNGSAGRALAAGQSVILDAVFARAAERDAAKALAVRAGVPFRAFWLEADRGMMHARIEARRGDVSDATPAVLERQLGYDLGPLDWTRIDASGPVETVAARLLDAMTSKRGNPADDGL